MIDRPKAIVATTVDDSHMWNLIGIEHELADRGFEVLNLGCCTPPMLLAEAIRDVRPYLTVISSINGHGVTAGLDLAHNLKEYQAFSLSKIIIGGKLTTTNGLSMADVCALRSAGYHAILSGARAWPMFDRLLAGDRSAPAPILRGATGGRPFDAGAR